MSKETETTTENLIAELEILGNKTLSETTEFEWARYTIKMRELLTHMENEQNAKA